jgi:hypothetical protein
MAGSTISKKVTTTVTLGVGGYSSPLTIASNGTIDPGATGAIGLYVASGVTGTIVSDGDIFGAIGGASRGGQGVFLYGAVTLTNSNFIEGGYGGGLGGNKGYGLHGGGGVYAPGDDHVTNLGLIIGGGGGGGYQFGGVGGIGLYLGNGGATLTNIANGGLDGIVGGTGGSSYYNGGNGGFGVYMFGAATNESFIKGGNGGGDLKGSIAGNGGIGVVVNDAVLLDNTAQGHVTGGAGGNAERFGTLAGNGGIGVYLTIGGYVSNLGHITGGAGGYIAQTKVTGNGGAGGIGLKAVEADSTFSNGGTITGGAGGYGNGTGGKGGIGVAIYGATGSSSGLIIGGAGAASGKGGEFGGNGNYGLVIIGGSFSNTGTILGGAAGAGVPGLTGRAAGGASVEDAMLSNGGTITGGYARYGLIADGGARVSNSGFIFGGSRGGIGMVLRPVSGQTNSVTNSVINSGTISGGGGNGVWPGGIGVYMVDSSLSNSSSGLIVAGFGAESQNAGDGVEIDGGTLTNSGTIIGSYGEYSEAGTGYGGVGVNATQAARIVNSGTIEGGSASQGFGGEFGHTGGTGVNLMTGTSLVNTGDIIGGYGGFGHNSGGDGGTGVYVDGGEFSNAGTVTGGNGGHAYEGGPVGTAGDAVLFGPVAGTLAIQQGAVFDGQVVANAMVADVLELTGSSSRALTGIGTQFTGFNDISFAAGAAWTIEGNVAGLADDQVITGLAAGDTIVLTGFSETGAADDAGTILLTSGGVSSDVTLGSAIAGDLLISAGGGNTTLAVGNSVLGATLSKGDFDYVFAGGTAAKLTEEAGARLIVDGGNVTSATLKISATATVTSGGIITDAAIDQKAVLLVTSGGAADAATITAGGTLKLAASGGLGGSLKFTGSGGELIVDQSKLPTAVISGFAAGDKIELADAAAASGTVKVAKAGVVTISAGGHSYALNIAGAKVGETNFKFSSHTLTETAAKMTILRPSAQAASGLPDLAEAGADSAMPAAPAYGQWSVSAASIAGFLHDLIQVHHGGSQSFITLQSGSDAVGFR